MFNSGSIFGSGRGEHPWKIAKIFALSGASGVLILLEPDLGTSIVYGVITLSCLWSCGSPKKYFLALFASGLAALPSNVGIS